MYTKSPPHFLSISKQARLHAFRACLFPKVPKCHKRAINSSQQKFSWTSIHPIFSSTVDTCGQQFKPHRYGLRAWTSEKKLSPRYISLPLNAHCAPVFTAWKWYLPWRAGWTVSSFSTLTLHLDQYPVLTQLTPHTSCSPI